MKLKRRGNRSLERGQVMTEYIIVLALFALVAVAMLTLTYFFSLHGGRLVDFVSMEYP